MSAEGASGARETPPEDPRGLIWEAYRIEGITGPDCRSIYFDWALGMAPGTDLAAQTASLLARHAPLWPDHPMTAVLREGASAAPPRTGRRRPRDPA